MSVLPSRVIHVTVLLLSLVAAEPMIGMGTPIARALDLEQVLTEVDARDATLASHRHMARAAHAREKRTGAWDAPMLDLMVENVPVGGRFDMDPMTMRVVGLEQRVQLFGSRGLARRAAGREAQAADANTEGMRWERFA